MREETTSDTIVVQHLQRVLASRTFARASRLCSLLEFIVVSTVDGRLAELSEQQIGIQVFGRMPGYNSSEDTIVRGTVRHLRQRLADYYESEGSNEPIRIEIPRGSYIAAFSEVSSAPSTSDPVVAPPSTEESNTSSFTPDLIAIQPSSPRSPWKAAALVLSLLVCCLATALVVQKERLARQQEQVLSGRALPLGPQPLWHAIFTENRKTLIVPGDASLDTFIAWEQRPVSLEQYATQSYQAEPNVTRPPTHLDVPLSNRSETPMADLALVTALTRAAERMEPPRAATSIEIRYARDVVVADTHDNNLILIGAESFNPWVTLYQHEMDFVARWDYATDIYSVENKAPKPGELAIYKYDRRTRDPQKAITHIALLNNTQGLGRVLIIEGTTMGSAYGAVNFFTHESISTPVIEQATDRSGRLHDFELLLSGDLIHGGMGNTKVIALHVH